MNENGKFIAVGDMVIRDADGNQVSCPIIPIEAMMPHLICEAMCVECKHRWIDVRPEGTLLKDLECPGCGKRGFVICTGEIIPDVEEELY